LLGLAAKLFGSSNDRALKAYYKQIAPINELEPRFAAMSDADLQNQTRLFRERLDNGQSLDDIKYEAFAVVREAAKRDARPAPL
jgi:preprotein translocase subunit SecA